MSDDHGNVVDLAAARARIKAEKRIGQPSAEIRSEYAKHCPIDDLVSKAAELNPEVLLYGTEEEQVREFVRCGLLDPGDLDTSVELMAILQGAGAFTFGPCRSSTDNQDFDIGA